MTTGADGRFADAAFAQLTFDLQMRQLERATGTAQALLSAVTLSGALAGPLLAIGLEPNAYGYTLSALVAAYLGVLALAIRACLAIVYTRPGDAPTGATSVLHYRHISDVASPVAYAERVLSMTDRQQLESVLTDTYVISKIVAKKANEMRKAVAWTKWTLALLGIMVFVKAVSLVAA